MEADDFRLHLFDDGAHVRIEWEPQCAAIARLDPKFGVIGLEQSPPRAVVGVAGHVVTEEVEVEPPLRPPANFGHLGTGLIRRQ